MLESPMDYETWSKIGEGLAYLSGAYEGGLAISEYVSEGGVIDVSSALTAACIFGLGYLARKFRVSYYRKKKLEEEDFKKGDL